MLRDRNFRIHNDLSVVAEVDRFNSLELLTPITDVREINLEPLKELIVAQTYQHCAGRIAHRDLHVLRIR